MAEGRSRGPVVGEYLDRVQQVEGLVGDTVTAFATVLPPRLRDSPTLSCAVAVLIATSETLGVGLPSPFREIQYRRKNQSRLVSGWVEDVQNLRKSDQFGQDHCANAWSQERADEITEVSCKEENKDSSGSRHRGDPRNWVGETDVSNGFRFTAWGNYPLTV